MIDIDKFRMEVKLGAVDRGNFSIEIPVTKKIWHKNYEPHPKYLNDIGLLKLDSYALRKEFKNSRDGKL